MGSRSAVVLQVQKFLAIDEAKVELSTLGQIPAEMKFSWRANKGFTRERSILYQELKLLGLVRRSNTINIYREKNTHILFGILQIINPNPQPPQPLQPGEGQNCKGQKCTEHELVLLMFFVLKRLDDLL